MNKTKPASLRQAISSIAEMYKIHRINKIAHNSVQETSSKTIFKVQVKKCYIRIKQFNLVHINHPLSDKNLY